MVFMRLFTKRAIEEIVRVPKNTSLAKLSTLFWLNCANSISANSAFINGSSLRARVTDEYRTGTPSLRSRSPKARTVALS